MSRSRRVRTVRTSHGSLAVEECGEGKLAVLLIHGNSSCRRVFERQIDSELTERHRLITFDLPGHGQSDNAPDPTRSYTLPGLADAVTELLTSLQISSFVVVGWSLGGHIGIELMRCEGLKGLMITGTPAIRRGGMAEGFIASPHFQFASHAVLADSEVDAFARAMFGDPVQPFVRDAIARTDSHFRYRLFEARRAGAGSDQRLAVERSCVPLGVVNGADDGLVNLDYIDTVAYRRLWSGRCHRLRNAGHAPFWHQADAYNHHLSRFLDDVETMRI